MEERTSFYAEKSFMVEADDSLTAGCGDDMINGSGEANESVSLNGISYCLLVSKY